MERWLRDMIDAVTTDASMPVGEVLVLGAEGSFATTSGHHGRLERGDGGPPAVELER